MPGRRRRRREQQYSERELFCFLVLAVATGYGRLNRVSFHACAINTIFATLTIQAGGGCGVRDFPVAVGEEGERGGLCVCV